MFQAPACLLKGSWLFGSLKNANSLPMHQKFFCYHVPSAMFCAAYLYFTYGNSL